MPLSETRAREFGLIGGQVRFEQHFGKPDDAVEGGANFVAHVGHELGLDSQGFERGLARCHQLGVLGFEFREQAGASLGELPHHQRLGGGGPGFIAQLNFAGLTVAIGDLFAAQQIAQLRLGDREVGRLHDTIVDPGAQRFADGSAGRIVGKHYQRDRPPVGRIPYLSEKRSDRPSELSISMQSARRTTSSSSASATDCAIAIS